MARHLSDADFWQACRQLQSKAAGTCTSLEIESFEGHPGYLRVRRTMQPEKSSSAVQSIMPPSDHEEEEIEDIFEHNVIYPGKTNEHGIRIEYDVLYSQTYRVPVLYFHIINNEVAAIDKSQFVYDYLVPRSRLGELQDVGVIGGISQANHPVTDIPCFFVHPCRTAEAMALLLENRPICPFEYLQVWIGLIGSAVGLDLPIELAT